MADLSEKEKKLVYPTLLACVAAAGGVTGYMNNMPRGYSREFQEQQLQAALLSGVLEMSDADKKFSPQTLEELRAAQKAIETKVAEERPNELKLYQMKNNEAAKKSVYWAIGTAAASGVGFAALCAAMPKKRDDELGEEQEEQKRTRII